jgi:hypothetical protein
MGGWPDLPGEPWPDAVLRTLADQYHAMQAAYQTCMADPYAAGAWGGCADLGRRAQRLWGEYQAVDNRDTALVVAVVGALLVLAPLVWLALRPQRRIA